MYKRPTLPIDDPTLPHRGNLRNSELKSSLILRYSIKISTTISFVVIIFLWTTHHTTTKKTSFIWCIIYVIDSCIFAMASIVLMCTIPTIPVLLSKNCLVMKVYSFYRLADLTSVTSTGYHLSATDRLKALSELRTKCELF